MGSAICFPSRYEIMESFERPNTTEIDGVRTLWTNAPRPFTAALMFRVGFFDEALRTRGITHLVEHLALAPLRETEVSFNGTVEGFKTTLVAQGHPGAVGEFLAAACRSLGDLPTDRLDVERDVLKRESASKMSFTYMTKICAAYFGSRGPGLMHYPELGLSWLGPDELEAWSARYFNKSNAVLALTGPPPDDWELPLPEGERQPLEVAQRYFPAPEAPVLLQKQPCGVSWGALVDVPRQAMEPAVMTSIAVLSKRLVDRLRHDLGRTYAVSDTYIRFDRDLVYTGLGLDSDVDHSREVATEFHDVVGRYLDAGPTSEELQLYARRWESQFADFPDRALREYLMADAEAVACDWGETAAPSEVIEKLQALEPDDVRTRFAEAYRQSFTIADLLKGVLGESARLEVGRPMAGTQFMRRLRRKAGRAASSSGAEVSPCCTRANGCWCHPRRSKLRYSRIPW